MSARHTARQIAVQALYALDMNTQADPEDAVRSAREEAGGRDCDVDFLSDLVVGSWPLRKALDEVISSASRHWKVSRMDRVDVSVLRLSTFELLHRPDIPVQVVLNEGVELAKEFGAPESSAFVNGILDRVAREHRGQDLTR